MLDQLMNLVRRYAQQPVIENPAVPNQHNEAVIEEAGQSIFSKLKNMVTQGNTAALPGFLEGDQSNTAVQDIKQDFAGNIHRKFGIDIGNALNVANSLIPSVLQSLVNRRDANGQEGPLSGLLASLRGGNSPGATLQSLGNKLGLDKDGDGDVDLSDLTRMFRK